jgi:mevalonate kinase
VSKKQFNGHGKLLLFGEYAVLDGAKSLAVPCKVGQSLEVKPHRGSDLIWESYDHDGELWFEAQISLYDFSSIRTSDEKVSKFLQKLLKGAVRYNTEFLNKWNGFKVINRLDFPREWGLGTSSTVIYNVAHWADVNPFHLHFYVSSGSGYDIACAGAEGPILYQLKEDELSYREVDFIPSFIDQIYFLYLGRKQSSGEGIIHYTKNAKRRKQVADEISKLTEEALACDDITTYSKIIEEHEQIISTELKLQKVKEEQFADFDGAIKSLGAWGGDFAMIVSEEPEKEIRKYFNNKSLDTILPYRDLIFSN